mmetsp:Transcript_4783/g.7415  ORF Transcript_4783/g.7415 Transcript_4783/m.7415 type:complete len:82 (-) Transcript_4783:6-251(-)
MMSVSCLVARLPRKQCATCTNDVDDMACSKVMRELHVNFIAADRTAGSTTTARQHARNAMHMLQRIDLHRRAGFSGLAVAA